MRYHLHEPEVIRLTGEYGVTMAEINELGGLDGELALGGVDRAAVVAYWRVFQRQFYGGSVDYDINGLFRPEFQLTYED